MKWFCLLCNVTILKSSIIHEQQRNFFHCKSLRKNLPNFTGRTALGTKSYSNAAFQINKSQEPLTSYDEQEWLSIHGIGKGIVPKLMSLISTGTFPQLDNYLEITPKGVLAMLRIKGLGAKKLLIVWKEMGIETVG